MDKLSDAEEIVEEERIYRLRTNDDQWQCLYEYRCRTWDENLDHLTLQSAYQIDRIEEQVAGEYWLWTVEYFNEEQEIDIKESDMFAND